MVQPLNYSLDFDAKLPPSAEIGMAQADEHAREEWKRQMDACILAVARRMEFFTVDDVIAEFEDLKIKYLTHHLCALGPRMVRVSKELQYMVGTGERARSKRPEKNGNLHTIWKSKMFQVSGVTSS